MANSYNPNKNLKKPWNGAMFFCPFDTKIILSVPIVTSQIRAKNIRIGRTTYEYSSGLSKKLAIAIVVFTKINRLQLEFLFLGNNL